jgi:AcrR family transcriptional regulator
MPRLSPADRAARRRQIEDAALELFRERGFHGVGLRDIAASAGVSLGNIYNHFSAKEPIFDALVSRLHAEFVATSEPLARFVATCRLPADVAELGRVMGEMIESHRDYLTLVYIDIAEFNGVHVRPHYLAMADKFRAAMPAQADGQLAGWVDPGAALAVIYMQFSSYFVVERLIGARGHLGLADPEAVQFISRCFLEGILPRGGGEEES